MPKDLPAEDIRQVYNSYCDDLLRRIDNMFVFLLLIEWVLAILLASLGTSPSIHGHSSIYVAIAAGALLALGPFYLVRRNLGAKINRYVITISQVLFSILLIFLTGERIETHFLVFISISFVSFYADWHLIVLGTALVMLDHLILGIHWSVAEHMAWLLFLDAVLIYYIKERKKMLWSIALKEVSLQRAMDSSEQKSQKRTWELQESINVILEQQQSLVASAKMSTLGEMSAGIAHEINNPLTIIIGKTSRLKKRLEANVVDREELLVGLTQIVETSNRIVKIIKGLRTFSRDGENDPMEIVLVSQVIQDTLDLCQERFKDNSIELRVDLGSNLDAKIEGRAVQLSQVLFNLLNNAIDAISVLPEKWVEIKVLINGNICSITVTDSGHGILSQVQDKLMLPFFTTKEVGKGTGLGLSISKVIIERHNGRLFYDASSSNTRFVIELPLISQ